MEGPSGKNYYRYKNGTVSAIKNQVLGDGGVAIGWGSFVGYKNKKTKTFSASTLNRYRTKYGIDLNDKNQFVSIKICNKLFDIELKEKEKKVRNWLKNKKIKSIQQQMFDAIVIQIYNSGGDGKLLPYINR